MFSSSDDHLHLWTPNSLNSLFHLAGENKKKQKNKKYFYFKSNNSRASDDFIVFLFYHCTPSCWATPLFTPSDHRRRPKRFFSFSFHGRGTTNLLGSSGNSWCQSLPPFNVSAVLESFSIKDMTIITAKHLPPPFLVYRCAEKRRRIKIHFFFKFTNDSGYTSWWGGG